MARILAFGLLALTFALGVYAGLGQMTKIPVVATFSIVGDLTQRIGGDAISPHHPGGARRGCACVRTRPPTHSVRWPGRSCWWPTAWASSPGWQRLTEAAAFKGKLVEATKGIERLWPGPG